MLFSFYTLWGNLSDASHTLAIILLVRFNNHRSAAVVSDTARGDVNGAHGLVSFPEVEGCHQVLITIHRRIVSAATTRIEARAGIYALIARQPVTGIRILEHGNITAYRGVEHLHIVLRRNSPTHRTDTLHVL